MDFWKFQLGQRVKLIESGEEGVVKGRAEYDDNRPPCYYVLYKSGTGCQRACWWDQNEIVAA